MKINEIDLRALSAFDHVARLGSFAKAAVALNETPVTVRHRVSALEREAAAPLFSRTNRGMKLTEHGQRILPRVRKILGGLDELSREIAAARNSPSLVRVGFLPSLFYPLGRRLLEEVNARRPDIRLQVFSGSSLDLQERLTSGSVDIAVLFNSSKGRIGNMKPLASMGHYLLGSVGDPLTRQKEVSFSQLKGLPLILPDRTNELRLCLDRAAKKVGIELTVAMEVNSLPVQREIVAKGGYYTIFAECAVRWSLQNIPFQAARLVRPEVERTLTIGTKPRGPISLAGRTVMRFLRGLVEDLKVEGIPAPQRNARTVVERGAPARKAEGRAKLLQYTD
jgi:DNA-binding transcriptional LysR family regulator